VRATLSLGRIAGVKVGINWSALAIVVVIVAGLATDQLPSAYPGRSAAAYLAVALVAAVLFLASLLAHELAHSIVARRNGVEVNSIVLWLLGGVAQLEGEPRTPGADFRIAVVGPLTSLGLGAVFGAIGAIAAALDADGLRSAAHLLGRHQHPARGLQPDTAAPLTRSGAAGGLWRRSGNRAAAITAARAGCLSVAMVGLDAAGALPHVQGSGWS
jgi:Zn-dependent protease